MDVQTTERTAATGISRPVPQRLLVAFWCLLLLCSVAVADARASRDVLVGIYENQPKIFTGHDGQAAGIFVDLLSEIAARERWRINYVACEWAQCLAMLESGEIDLMPDVAISDERQQRFAFHKVVALHSWSQVFKSQASGIESMLDLDGKRIAMLADSFQESALRAMLSGFDISFEIVPAKSLEQAFEMTASGETDVAVGNHLFGGRQAPAYGLSPAPVVFQPARLFFATRVGQNADLLDGIDRQLKPLKADTGSAYFDILERWAAPPPEFRVPARFQKVMTALLLMGSALLVYAAVLRVRVLTRTREREGLAQQVTESEARYRELAESIHDVIWTIDPETCSYTYISPSVQRLRGFSPEEVMAAPLEQALAPDHVERVRQLIRQSMTEFLSGQRSSEDAVLIEVEQLRRDGSTVWTEVVGNVSRNSRTGRLELRGVTRDISERKQAEAQIQQLAHFDQLTGLPNRVLLKDRFAQTLAMAVRHQQPFGVVFLDLDHFKDINDTLGHVAGDCLLVEVARRLELVLRAGDTVCRLGGDEFILLLGECDSEGVAAVVQKLIGVVSRPFMVSTHDLVTTPSIGIAMYPDDGEDLDTLLRRADTAMYRAKREGRCAYRFFTAEMQAQSERALTLVNALRQAIAMEQLHLHYQPQFDLSSHKLVGVEALLRWTHPKLGIVSPQEFIPVAESNGLIMEIGAWVIREAASQIRRWEDAGNAPPRVAVNLSSVQFRNSELPNAIRSALAQAGVLPDRLELELTEAVAMDDPVVAERLMSQFSEAGISVAIDDFGTGHSSLSYLKRFNVDKLKIDQSFVRDISEDEDDRAIVRAIIRLAQSLNLRTIAEGVETVEQLAFLKAEGCDEVQGYLLGRPVPAGQLQTTWQHAD